MRKMTNLVVICYFLQIFLKKYIFSSIPLSIIAYLIPIAYIVFVIIYWKTKKDYLFLLVGCVYLIVNVMNTHEFWVG
jgi:hypothetical protein